MNLAVKKLRALSVEITDTIRVPSLIKRNANVRYDEKRTRGNTPRTSRRVLELPPALPVFLFELTGKSAFYFVTPYNQARANACWCTVE